MIKCYVPCCFQVDPKGWLSKLLLKLGLFHWQAKIWHPDITLSVIPGVTYYKHYSSSVLLTCTTRCATLIVGEYNGQ